MDDWKKDYEDLKYQFKSTNFNEFKKGEWFSKFISWLLKEYAQNVNWEYIQKKYPGLNSESQAKKAIKLASRYNGLCGATTAGIVTTAEIVTLTTKGTTAPITVPAIASSIILDVAYTTRIQLRTTYDLSVIYKSPLLMNDVEDCYLLFLSAFGVKTAEIIGKGGKILGPQILAYNVRKLLRAGLRGAIKSVLTRVGGVQLGKKATERACLRLLVPGIGVPIAYAANYYFTKWLLSAANSKFRVRGAIIQPLVALFKIDKILDKKIILKCLILVVESANNEIWCEEQMNCIRYTQNFLNISDEDLKEMDSFFDREIEDFLKEPLSIKQDAANYLIEYLSVASSLDDEKNKYPTYAKAIIDIGASCEINNLNQEQIISKIKSYRKKLF